MSERSNRLAQRKEDELGQLLATRRWCYVIPAENFVEGHGFRVSIAIEHKGGHWPTGSLDVLSDDRAVVRAAYAAGKGAPWFWGITFDEAKQVCKEMNESKLGYSERDVALIVASTMGKVTG